MHRLIGLVAIASMLRAPHAMAGGFVIESHADERPVDASEILAPLFDELSAHGFATRPAVIASVFGGLLPLPGIAEPSLTAAGLAERVELGIKEGISKNGDLRSSAAQLEAAIKDIHDNLALVVRDDNSRKWITKAFAGLAFAYGRLGEKHAATEAVLEQHRSYPEFPITLAIAGPEVVELANAVSKAADAGPRGGLLVDVITSDGTSADAQIFVDGVGRGRGGTFSADLIPGLIRVLVQLSGVACLYSVRVHPGESTRLSVTWAIDSAFMVSKDWIGFVWHGQHDQSAKAAERYARANKLDDVVVVTIGRRGGQRAVFGTLFERGTGTALRKGTAVLGGDQEVGLRALATYLRDGTPSPYVLDRSSADEPRHDTPAMWPAWSSWGLAVTLVAGGAVGIRYNSKGTCGSTISVCPQDYGTGRIGWASIGVGVLAAGFGTYWFITRRDRPQRGAMAFGLTPLGTIGGMATLSGSF